MQDWNANEHGFAIFPDVFRPADFKGLSCVLSKPPGTRSRAGIRHAMKFHAVSGIAHDSRLLGIAQSALGRSAFPFRATLFEKTPRANWLVTWHQDTALPLRRQKDTQGWGPWSVKDGVIYAHAPARALERVLALRVHLDDSLDDNGPLRVLPGSHRLGVLTDESIQDLTATNNGYACLVATGGVVAMSPLIVHCSSKSRSSRPRRVLHIEYATSVNITDGLELAVA